jgi:hypothetical protein
MLIIVFMHLRNLLFHGRIPMVLNGVISSAFEGLSDVSPLISESSVVQIEDPFLLRAPLDLLNHRI